MWKGTECHAGDGEQVGHLDDTVIKCNAEGEHTRHDEGDSENEEGTTVYDHKEKAAREQWMQGVICLNVGVQAYVMDNGMGAKGERGER